MLCSFEVNDLKQDRNIPMGRNRMGTNTIAQPTMMLHIGKSVLPFLVKR